METKKVKTYIESVGRRKTATARVRITESSKGSLIVNDKEGSEYFMTDDLAKIVQEPFSKTKYPTKFDITVKVSGGGIHSQAEAVRHGITRALIEFDPEMRVKVKQLGFLTRDPRAKERRKFGLKKARKAPQWSKR